MRSVPLIGLAIHAARANGYKNLDSAHRPEIITTQVHATVMPFMRRRCILLSLGQE